MNMSFYMELIGMLNESFGAVIQQIIFSQPVPYTIRIQYPDK